MTVSPDTRSIDSYRRSCLEIATQRLSGYSSIAEIAAAEKEINAYPRLEKLAEPRGVFTLDTEELTGTQLDRAVSAVLDGRFLAEHAAAGEATRLKMGTKFLINPVHALKIESMAEAWSAEIGREVTPAEVLDRTHGTKPDDLLDLSLGLRHMLQMSFDLVRLAERNGRLPSEVLANQWTLLILNQTSAEAIVTDVAQSNFFGFNPAQVMFMIQESFEGIGLSEGRFGFDPEAPKRLHNHGQMAMQQTAVDQIFTFDLVNPGARRFLRPEEYREILDKMDDKLSYNIEDLTYLTGALDLEALALALDLGRQGFRMVMEIVANDPENPIKGGLAAFDEELGRNVMIESFQLMDKPNSELTYLNRNFNHYPQPAAAFDALASGLPMHIAVKGEHLYYQPIQGDLNFLLETAFVRRKFLSPLSSWKSAANTAAAIRAMANQDKQPGFKEFAEETLQRPL